MKKPARMGVLGGSSEVLWGTSVMAQGRSHHLKANLI
jgi:hypothetical protein